MSNRNVNDRSSLKMVFKCLLLAIFACSCVLAHADTIFSSGPPNQQGGNQMGDTVQFDAFTLTETSTTLTGVRFWSLEGAGQYRGSIDYIIFPDCGGSNGPSCNSGALNNVANTHVATGNVDASGQFAEFTNDFAINVTLGAGTYWIGLLNGNTVGFTDFYWEWADNTGGPGGWEYDLVCAQDPTCNPWNQNFSDHAFQLTGTATPEPASLALLGSGLIGLAGTARRRWSK